MKIKNRVPTGMGLFKNQKAPVKRTLSVEENATVVKIAGARDIQRKKKKS